MIFYYIMISLALVGIAWCSIWTMEEVNRNNLSGALVWLGFTLMNCFNFCVFLHEIIEGTVA